MAKKQAISKSKHSSAAESRPAALTRPPIVVVLGHVDHGKTTLLDTIRKTNIAAGEHGGITQKIGAYQVTVGANKITFIDTPGHEAFSQMRGRGVKVADIAVLVVAANDSVMPQTVESIKIIQEAKIPYVVAINKVDLPEANVDKVIQDLLRHNVLLENYGGDVPFVKVSALKNEGIKDLLEILILIAEMSGIKGDINAPLEAVTIEARLDKKTGPVATLIVRNGKLFIGQKIYIGDTESKVRALINDVGQRINETLPGMPVEVQGVSAVPQVGAVVSAAQERLQGEALKGPPRQAAGTISKENNSEGQRLNLILKSDNLGSLEAITSKLPANINLLESVTGEIAEADILLAKSTGAIILGFNTKVSPVATKLAETEKVLVRTYRIIYELLDELNDAAAGVLEPLHKEEVLGTGKIVAEFPYEKMRIAGVKVADGRLARGDMVRVLRGENVTGESRIKSARVGKEEVSKIEAPRECGILLDPQIDFTPGDDIIAYRFS